LFLSTGTCCAARLLARIGNDTITEYLFPFVEVGGSGTDVTWDFRQLANPDREYAIITSRPSPEDTDFVCIREPHMRSYWKSIGDSIFQIGYESSQLKMDFTQPELRLKRQWAIGDTLHGNFAAKGEYGHRIPIQMQGHTTAVLDAEGTVLLGNDTIQNVVRVHTTRQYSEVSNDSSNIKVQRWQWFVENNALPIVDVVRSTRTHASNTAMDTTIYAATWVKSFSQSRGEPNDKKSAHRKNTDNDSVFVQLNCVPNPVLDNLHITYCLTHDAEVKAEIYNPLGAKIFQLPLMHQQIGYYSFTVSMTDCMAGAYVLYLKAGDVELKKIIIKR